MRLHDHFAILLKLCAMFLRTNAKFEPGAVKAKLLQVDLKVNKTQTYSTLPGTIHLIGKVIKRFRLDSGLYWPWSMKVCPKTFWACFFHHPESVYKVGPESVYKVGPRCVQISCQKISAPRKSPGRLTFDLLTQTSTCSSRFSSIVGIWSKKSLHWKRS